jgi:hypothetical protein
MFVQTSNKSSYLFLTTVETKPHIDSATLFSTKLLVSIHAIRIYVTIEEARASEMPIAMETQLR